MGSFEQALSAVLSRAANTLHSHHIDEILADPDLALKLAVGAAAGASNIITSNPKDHGSAVVLQDQARLWMDLNKQIKNDKLQKAWEKSTEVESEPQTFDEEPSSGSEDQPVS